MSSRRFPIVSGQIYHVFNRSVAKQPIFLDSRDYQRFCEAINFYRFYRPPIRFSYFCRLSQNLKNEIMTSQIKTGKKLVEIFAFCLIPNHFHFLLKCQENSGVQRFIGNLQNSYAKYFNFKRKRNGAIFQEMFKSVLITSEEQFIQVARYIHLNPYSSLLLAKIEDLDSYLWSSWPHYLGKNKYPFLQENFLGNFYKNRQEMKKHTFDQADYQKQRKILEHLLLE